jgi:hypothetical protein
VIPAVRGYNRERRVIIFSMSVLRHIGALLRGGRALPFKSSSFSPL